MCRRSPGESVIDGIETSGSSVVATTARHRVVTAGMEADRAPA
jgi:hypothetical protein